MPGQRLLAVVTALILVSGASANAQDYSLDELLAVERLILSKDVEALKSYLESNPALLLGDDAFARELRTLKQQLDDELLAEFAIRRGVFFESGSDTY